MHVWRVDLDQPEPEVARAVALLGDDERLAVARSSSSVRRRRILSRAALRTVLGLYLERPPETLTFGYGAFGKPRLAEPGAVGVHFNLSHSDDRGLIAVTRCGRVGIDVERRVPIGDVDAIAARVFAAAEVADIAKLHGGRKLTAFWACWTRKEAFVKAMGGGLSMPLDRFTVSVRDDQPPVILTLENDDPRAWTLASARPWPGHLAAVAVRPRDRSAPVTVRTWTLGQVGEQPVRLAERLGGAATMLARGGRRSRPR